MCYSAESSLISFLLGFAASFYLFQKKDKYLKHLGFHFMTVVLMQLAEFFLWISYKNCSQINQFVSKSIPFILMTQMYSLILGGYLFKTIPINLNLYKIILLIFTIYYIHVSSKPFFSKKKFCTKPDKETKSLKWDHYHEFMIESTNAEDIYFIIGNVFFLILSYHSKIWLLTYIILNIFYQLSIRKKINYSIWCFYAAGIPIIVLLFTNILQQSHKQKK